MESVLRGLIIYFFLLLIFRIADKRTLSQTTPFDFVLLLIISETTQQALVGSDGSIVNSVLLVLTLVGTSIALSVAKQYVPMIEKVLESTPVVVLDKGRLLKRAMDKVRVDQDDILEAARQLHGLKALEQIEYAIVERNGEISIIPARPGAARTSTAAGRSE